MGKRETEVKLRIEDLVALRRRLRELGFRPIHRRSLEDNVLFDTAQHRLDKARCLLRLRHYGSCGMVTYKGAPTPNRFFKSRPEMESEVTNPEGIRAVFEALGLRPVFRYQKFRTQYVKNEEVGRRRWAVEAAMDETPIGNFLELEGGCAAIDRVARQLGYSRADYCTASYRTLYLEDCRRRKIQPGDMVFAVKSSAGFRTG